MWRYSSIANDREKASEDVKGCRWDWRETTVKKSKRIWREYMV
jgi:hypothetical protein